MSEEDGTADCSHMILAPVGLQSFLLLHRRTRGSRARATPASDTIRGQRRHILNNAPQCGNVSAATTTLRWNYSCLGHMSWPEVAFPNAFTIGNDTIVETNTALELLLPLTHCVRGSIPQRIPNRQRVDSDYNTVPLELLLPQTYFVVRGSIPNAFPLGNVPIANLNTALELLLPLTHFVVRGSIPQRIPIE